MSVVYTKNSDIANNAITTDNRFLNPKSIIESCQGKIFITNDGNTNLPPNSNTELVLPYDTEFYTDNDLNNEKHFVTIQCKPKGQDNVYVFVHPDMTNVELPSIDDFKDPLIINQIQSGIINLNPLSDTSIPLIEMIQIMSGYKVRLVDCDTKKLTSKIPTVTDTDTNTDTDTDTTEKIRYVPEITIDLVGFFHVVDLKGILYCEYDSSLWESFINPLSEGRIEYRKHLNSNIRVGKNGHRNQTIKVINKVLRFTKGDFTQDYVIQLKLTDICALVGHGSYANMAKVAGHKLLHKDDLTQAEKSDILTTYRNLPDKVIRYAQGDCECVEIYEKFSTLIQSVYRSCDLPNKGVTAQKTIGSTVNKLILTFLANYTGKSIDDIEKKYLNHTAADLKIFSKTSELLLSLTYGGRCLSNVSLLIRIINSVIVDQDFDGAYNSMINSIFSNFILSKSPPNKYTIPLKNPRDIRNRKNLDLSKAITLRKFLSERNYGTKYSQLIPGLYQINITSKTNKMSYKQDFFVSKYDFQITQNSDKTDYLKEKTGVTKIFSHDIFNGILTENSLQLLLTDPNKKFVEYMLDNLLVVSASWYSPAKEKFTMSEVDNIDGSWYRIPVSLLSVLLQSLRKAHGKKSSLGIVFKYIVNTMFGVFCSPFFLISNPIVANNITDGIRVACYCLEKVTNGIKSITDGCQSDFNNVIVNRQESDCFTMSNLVGVNNLVNKQDLTDKHLEKTGFLGKTWTIANKIYTDKDGKNIIAPMLSDGTRLYDSKQINKLIYDAVKNRYPTLPIFNYPTQSGGFLEVSINDPIIADKKILCQDDKSIKYFHPDTNTGIVGIDIKGTYTDMVGTGSANYLMIDNYTDVSQLPDDNKPDTEVMAYRSFNKKGYKSVGPDNSLTPCDNPAKKFLKNILKDPCNVPYGEIYHKEQILMPNMYRENKTKFDILGIPLGASYSMVGYVRHFSMSSFTYQNYDQYCNIKKDIDKHNMKYGQSLEMYFPGDIENTVNLESMNKFFSDFVASGQVNVMGFLQKKIKLTEEDKFHPNYHRLIELKNIIVGPWTKYLNDQNVKNKKVDYGFIELDFGQEIENVDHDDYVPTDENDDTDHYVDTGSLFL